MKPYKFVFNPNLNGSPARNFSQTGIIEYGNNFLNLPAPVKTFILLHEIGHFFYKTEKYCDIFAAKNFIDMGYNNSTAFYALSKVLRESAANKERENFLFNHLNHHSK